MIRFNGVDVPVEDVVEVYFNDHRIIRMLKSMRQINSALSVASFILLIPLLASLMDPSRDYLLLLCLTIVPAVSVGQLSSFVAKRAKKERSIRLLKSSAVLAVSYCILASIGLAAVTALLILTLQVCQRPTCVSDAICAGILCLTTVIGIVYNIVHSQLLIKSIWHNEFLLERTTSLDLDSISEERTVQTISEATERSESPASEQGFDYTRITTPAEVFP